MGAPLTYRPKCVRTLRALCGSLVCRGSPWDEMHENGGVGLAQGWLDLRDDSSSRDDQRKTDDFAACSACLGLLIGLLIERR